MSHRPHKAKQIKRLRDAIATQPLQAHMDLIDYLKTRRYARTSGEAEKLLLAGCVRSESHVLGQQTIKVMEKGKITDKVIVQPIVPASLRQTITVYPLPT